MKEEKAFLALAVSQFFFPFNFADSQQTTRVEKGGVGMGKKGEEAGGGGGGGWNL